MLGARKTPVKVGVRRLLRLDVVEARNLTIPPGARPPAARLGGTNGEVDSFVRVQLLDLNERPKEKETFNTSVVKSSTPRYNQAFEVGQSFDLDVDELPSVQFLVYHKAGVLSFGTGGDTLLGQVTVQLSSLASGDVDEWFALQAGAGSTPGGELHLRLRLDPRTAPVASPSSSSGSSGKPGAAGSTTPSVKDVEDPETVGLPPNELVVTVIQARNLQALDTSLFTREKTSDPFVKIKLLGGGSTSPSFQKEKTKVVLKNHIRPSWNETFTWAGVKDSALSLHVVVKDKDTMTDSFMGGVDIPIAAFRDKVMVRKWYTLVGDHGESDGKDRGELELQIHWRTSFAVIKEDNEKLYKSPGVLTRIFGKKVDPALEEDDDDDNFGGADDNDDEDDIPQSAETPEEIEKRQKAEEEKINMLNQIVIQSGDYQVQVHVIEARDLKGENFDGTSDPIVQVECFGQKQHTRVVKSCNSCVFDELLIFNLKNVDKEQFMQGVVRVTCKSSVKIGHSPMIGSYAFDASTIYQSNKDHELYRQWVALMDDEDADDVGVQGYLKLSVFILGPGDKQKIHDEEKEILQEQEREVKAGGDISSMILTVPVIRKEWKFIVATIYKAQGLPVMDGKSGIGSFGTKAKTDALIKLQIAGAKRFKSQTVTVEGETAAAINPQFFCEIWYPVSIPTTTNIIKMSVWDQDIAEYELIGNVITKISDIKQGRGPGRYVADDMRWYNVYGAPEFKTDTNIGQNLKKAAGAMRKGFKLAAGEQDWKLWYNNVPEKAPAYKGRVLASFRMERKRPSKRDTPEIRPFLRSLMSSKISREQVDAEVLNMESKSIPTDEYCLHAIVVCGSDMPQFMSLKTLGTSQKMRVRISVGLNSLTTAERSNEQGSCRWNVRLSQDSIALPHDPQQIPDLFIYLLKEDERPVCFKRIKASELLAVEDPFSQPAHWFLLSEDKSIDCLNEDEFPGTILIKLGFGLRKKFALEPEIVEAWNRAERVCRNATPYQLRVHVYQGAELPSADSNGLCDPFIQVSFLGKKLKTKTIKKTLYPAYYQTLVFNDVSICDFDGFQFASQITFRLFDQDPAGTEYLGTFPLPLSDSEAVFVSADHNIAGINLPEPKWFDFFKEIPGDGQGRLLVLAQLIPTEGRSIPVPNFEKLDEANKHLSIIPASKDCYIEVLAIGLRDLSPYRFIPMQNPFMEVTLHSVGTHYESKTRTSKLPNPANPNFLEVIQMAVKLPLKSVFAAPIHISVSDTRLGGYSKPVVGVGTIDLRKKLPWCPETYEPPGKDLFTANIDVSNVAAEWRRMSVRPDGTSAASSWEHLDAAQRLKLEMEQRRLQDDFIVSPEAPDVDEILQRKVKDIDTGAGVFGALTHIKVQGGRVKKSRAESAFASDLDWNEDDTELPPAWMQGRRKLESDLETELQSSPFETYTLIRGKIHGGLLGQRSTVRVVGKFKGLVRVTEEHPSGSSMLPKEIMDMLLRPRPYKIRLYVLRATGLAKKDFNLDGSPAPSDPYVKVKFGKFKFNDRENAVNDATDVDLFKVFEMDAELPGTSQLQIKIMDKDLIGADDLIGSTVIDLEDRLFDGRWQKLGQENMIVTGQDSNNKERVRWATKPVERRNLTTPSQTQPQGLLECFLDIMRPEEAIVFPAEDVSLPPKQLFELRVVVWQARDVPPMDSFEGMSDLFVKVIPEGCPAQETDTHWRAKKGKASWNWRLLFDIELGHNSRAMKFPHLRFQLWDRDILKWNDCAGETVINLGPYYRKAFKKNIAIKLFEKKQGAAAVRAKRSADLKPSKVLDTGGADIPSPEPESAGSGSGSGGGGGIGGDPKALSVDDTSPTASSPSLSPLASPALVPSSASPPPLPKEEDSDTTPLMKSAQENQDEDDEDMKEQVRSFKSMTGLWPDIDPPDSEWIKIGKKDHNTDKFEPMGSICVSIQIWPKNKSIIMPVGAARNEPNTNPFLPPPVGRLKFSWNPFVLGTELCGPKLCATFTCCLLCAAFIVLMIFCQPFLVSDPHASFLLKVLSSHPFPLSSHRIL